MQTKRYIGSYVNSLSNFSTIVFYPSTATDFAKSSEDRTIYMCVFNLCYFISMSDRGCIST